MRQTPLASSRPLALLLLVCALLSHLHRSHAEPPDGIRLLPQDISLTGPESRQQLLTLKLNDNRFTGQIPSPAYHSADPLVATVDDTGTVIPRGNGTTTLTSSSDGHRASTTVTVSGFDQTQSWSFRNHVLPVLSKAGCNQGGCHGALAGKGGFRLSLRGYDPLTDHHRITREARGRRVDLSQPARSLLLTKPTTAVPHKGGRRLEPGSRDYRILAHWIANGAPPPSDNDPLLHHLEILPAESVLQPGDAQNLVVRAFYSDGRTEDVTQWARFASTDETVAEVDPVTGQVKVIGHGEGAITAWFSSRIVIAHVTSPFTNDIPAQRFAKAPRRNFIDELNLAQLQALNLLPSPRSSDAEFIRRVYVDAAGILPTPGEVRSFLDSSAPDKRASLIDRLLERGEYVDYWTYRFSDILLINGRLLRPEAVKTYHHWLRARVENGTPWDRLVRELVTSKGGSMENGASNFYAVHQDPETMAENVSQAFLSLSIGCAKCHNHPLEKWTNDQYYSFANLFARVKAKGWGGDPNAGDGARTVYVSDHGDLIQPRTGKPQPPAPLDATPLAFEDPSDRRESLAQWLTSPDNPYFTRSIANRIWAACFGRGLVEPVDDLRISNPASNEALLDALADHLVKEKYDLKSLLRLILNSETYQRTSQPLPENASDQRFFSRYYPRRLMAEVLHDAISGVTDIPSTFTNLARTDGSKEKTEFYPKGTRALQLFDSAVDSYFLQTFGRNQRAITCECERSAQPSMIQVLHLSNGDALNDRLSNSDSRVTHLLKSGISDPQLIESSYLWCLSRLPTQPEADGLAALLNQTDPALKREVLEDLFWALMTSREFLFQH